MVRSKHLQNQWKTSFSVIVGTLQLTERNEQALLDQARNHENPCKIKHFDSVLQSDDAGNLVINWKKHGETQTLIKPMGNELFSDYGDLTINRTQQTSTAGQGQGM
jgi:hypothetical protein